MEHGPSTDWGEDKASRYKTKIGLWMFLAYCVVYAGFVLVNSVWPKVMEKTLGSLNLALAYGMGLIALALVLAFVYNALSSREEERVNDQYTDDEEEVF